MRLRHENGMDDWQKSSDPFHEANLQAERKRIFDRHRFDIISKSFGPESHTTTLREYKRIFKIEMEENPERYTLMTGDGSGAKAGKNLKILQQESDKIKKAREAQIAEIRVHLDELIPVVKAIMSKKSDFTQKRSSLISPWQDQCLYNFRED